MSLTNPHPTPYVDGQTIHAAEVNSCFSQLPKAVDGIGGGTYTNSGADLSIVMPTGFRVSVDAAGGNTGAVFGVGSCLDVSDSALTVYGNASVAGTFTCTGAVSCTSTVTFNQAPSLAVSKTVAQPLIPSGMTAFAWDDSTASVKQGSSSTAGKATFFVRRIGDGATITNVTLKVISTQTHSSLPATMPGFSVTKRDANGTNTTLAGFTADSSATTGAFQAIHSISTGTISQVVNLDDDVFVEVNGETGANAQDNSFSVRKILITYTSNKIYPT